MPPPHDTGQGVYVVYSDGPARAWLEVRLRGPEAPLASVALIRLQDLVGPAERPCFDANTVCETDADFVKTYNPGPAHQEGWTFVRLITVWPGEKVLAVAFCSPDGVFDACTSGAQFGIRVVDDSGNRVGDLTYVGNYEF